MYSWAFKRDAVFHKCAIISSHIPCFINGDFALSKYPAQAKPFDYRYVSTFE
jgi:hypothetical protein